MKKSFQMAGLAFLCLLLCVSQVFGQGSKEPPVIIEEVVLPEEDPFGIVGTDGEEVLLSFGSHLVEFDISHSGMSMDSCWNYHITDPEVLARLEELVVEYEIGKWNGFNKVARGVLDGTGFTVSFLYSDGARIEAHGSNAFPSNYGKFHDAFESIIVELGILPNVYEWDGQYQKDPAYLSGHWSTDYSLSMGNKWLSMADLYFIPDGRLLILGKVHTSERGSNYYYGDEVLVVSKEYFWGNWEIVGEKLHVQVEELELDVVSDYRFQIMPDDALRMEFRLGSWSPNEVKREGDAEVRKDLSDLKGVWKNDYATEITKYYLNGSGDTYTVYAEGLMRCFADDHYYYVTTLNGELPDGIVVGDYTYDDGRLVEDGADIYEVEVIGNCLVLTSYLNEEPDYEFFYRQPEEKFSYGLEAILGTWMLEDDYGTISMEFKENDTYVIVRNRGGVEETVVNPYEMDGDHIIDEDGYLPYVIIGDQLYTYVKEYIPKAERYAYFTFGLKKVD